MPDPSDTAPPTAVRLRELENAVLDVLDARGIGAGQTVSLGDLETAMNARGYSGKWVKRAVESLLGRGWLRRSGTSFELATMPVSGAAVLATKPRLRRPRRQKRRKPLFGQ